MFFFNKIWLFIKKYWKISLAIGAAVVIFLLRGRVTSFANDYKQIKDVHDEEIKTIEKAHVEEREKKAAALEKLNKTLDAVEKEYQNNNENLNNKKKKEVARLVKDHGDDPNKLADELAKATGFRVIISED